MPIKLPGKPRTRKIIFRSAIGLFIIWALALPFFLQKESKETLSDIAPQAQSNPSPSAPSQPGTEKSVAATDSGVKQLATGSFKGINGRSASGDVKLLQINGKYFIRLEDNFSVSNGPDLFVTAGNNGKVEETFAKLKGNSGGQNYELPESFDPAKYSQIIIHCRAFAYSFGVADLTR